MYLLVNLTCSSQMHWLLIWECIVIQASPSASPPLLHLPSMGWGGAEPWCHETGWGSERASETSHETVLEILIVQSPCVVLLLGLYGVRSSEWCQGWVPCCSSLCLLHISGIRESFLYSGLMGIRASPNVRLVPAAGQSNTRHLVRSVVTALVTYSSMILDLDHCLNMGCVLSSRSTMYNFSWFFPFIEIMLTCSAVVCRKNHIGSCFVRIRTG